MWPSCRLFLLCTVTCFGLNGVVVNSWGRRPWINTRTSQVHARAITFVVEDDCTFDIKSNDEPIFQPHVVIIEPNSTTPIPESPRSWLESSPFGAYTVMRCDYHRTDATSSCPSGGSWYMWGRDFHLQRLRDSMQSLASLLPMQANNISLEVLDHACMRTEAVLDRLSTIDRNLTDIFHLEPAAATAAVVMVTILWYKGTGAGGNNPIVVRAHASCSGNKIVLGKSPFESAFHSKTEANVAMDFMSVPKWTVVVDVASNTASRQCFPQPYAKVSSWCKQRKPLEKWYMPQSMLVNSEENSRQALYPVSVNEVILTERIKSKSSSSVDSHLLEGLTSNLFVVYPDSVIRTAGQGILHGYARNLVMKAIRSIPNPTFASRTPFWTLDTITPISLSDAHLWQEVFCTSAIRLIVPVDRMLVPIFEDNECVTPVSNGKTIVKEIWRYEEGSRPQIWKQLLAFLLQIGEKG